MIQYAETIVSSIQVFFESLQPLSPLFVERLENRLIALKWKWKKKTLDLFCIFELNLFLLFPTLLGKSEMPVF